MNPDEQKPAYSIDYLNQIAAKPKKKISLSSNQTKIAGGVGLVLVLIITITLVAALNRPNTQLEHLTARLQSTETIVGDSQNNLKNTDLRSQNSSLKIYLSNANLDIEPLLAKNRVPSKLDSTIVKQEAGDDITNRLEDARLNAVYDKTYAREMAFRLGSIITLIRQIDNSSNSASLKDFLNTTMNNLIPTQKLLEDFKDTNN